MSWIRLKMLNVSKHFSPIIFAARDESCVETFFFATRNKTHHQRRSYASSNQNSSENVIIKIENGVRSITFNRPEKKNAMNIPMGMTIAQALIESNDDDNTNIVVFRGTGEYFTSGMDLSGFFPKKPEGESQTQSLPSSSVGNPKTRSGVLIFMKPFLNCKKPLIALVNGPALGFGVTMLGLFDTVYASDQATFKTRFGEWGLPPEFCSTYTFPRIMGYAKANHLLMCDNKMSAEEAYKCGLVSRIFPHASFQEESWKIVQEFAKLPIKSLIYSKELVRGRERELLRQVLRNEQEKFDPEVAKEVKRKFAERAERKNQF